MREHEIKAICQQWLREYCPADLKDQGGQITAGNAQLIMQHVVDSQPGIPDDQKVVSVQALIGAERYLRQTGRLIQFQPTKPKKGGAADRLYEAGFLGETGRKNWARRDDNESSTAKDAVKTMKAMDRQRVFTGKLNEIGSIIETTGGRINHGRTEAARQAAKGKLRVEFPEFAHLAE